VAKLRVLKERQEQVAVAADLRGFGDSEIFLGSGLSAHLFIFQDKARTAAQIPITSICEAYGLSRAEKTSTDVHPAFHLKVAHTTVGDHKTQALKLFVAALEVQRMSPMSRLVLFQTSGLRSSLHEKTRNETDGLSREIETVFHQKPDKNSMFSLHLPVALAIHQAGLLEHAPQSGWVHLSDSQIEFVHKKLAEPQNATTVKSRVG
jgi:hypothetical protein